MKVSIRIHAMRRILAAATSFAVAGASFAACAKNTHHAVEAEGTSAQLQMMHSEPADRSDAPHGHVEPPLIPECVTPDPAEPATGPSFSAPWYELQGAPAGTDALSHALRARGGKGLIGGDELKEIPNAEAQLRFLATHGELLIERQRALALLRNFPSETTRALLVRLSEAADLHVSLRATALRSLVAISSDDHIDAREVIERAKKSDELRIRKAVSGEVRHEANP